MEFSSGATAENSQNVSFFENREEIPIELISISNQYQYQKYQYQRINNKKFSC